MAVLRTIKRFLREHPMPPTKFGRLVAGDSRLMHDLEQGRELGAEMAARIEAFIAERRGAGQ